MCNVYSGYTTQGPAGDIQHAGGWVSSASRSSDRDTYEDLDTATRVRPITTSVILLLYEFADVLDEQVLKQDTEELTQRRGHLIGPLRDRRGGVYSIHRLGSHYRRQRPLCLLPTTRTIFHTGLDGLQSLSHDSLVPVCLGSLGCTAIASLPLIGSPGLATHPSPHSYHSSCLASQGT